MSRKKRREASEAGLRPETKHSVLGVIVIALALFFLLARFDRAGVAGRLIHRSASWLIGEGFLLLPLVFFLLGLSFFSASRPRIIPLRLAAAVILFLAALGLLAIFAPPEWSGLVGTKLFQSLNAFFDIYVTALFFIALAVSAVILIFDTRLKISGEWLRNRFRRSGRSPVVPVQSTVAEPAAVLSPPPIETPPPISPSPMIGSVKKEAPADRPLKIRTKTYTPPPLDLLESDRGRPDVGDIRANSNIIKRTLANFGIVVEMDEVSIGPSITRYALKPAEGIKLSRIVALQNDLSLALAAHPLRLEAPIPGKSLVGIEIPNSQKSTVGLASLLSASSYQNSSAPLLLALGKGISGESRFADLARAPHFLIAGATGSGKSVVIHNFVLSLLYRNPPERLRLILIDPKQVELTLYNKIPHLLSPVITDAKKAILALRWVIKEMERRYDLLEEAAVRDIASYQAGGEMPYIVVIIDELAHLMSLYPREFEAAVVRLAQMSRAVGIHLVLSTQRPSVEVITGLIKANIPSRLALQVASQVDSRTILDMAGAEKLLGAGDMLYLSADMGKPVRLQSAFVSETEVKKVVKFLAEQGGDDYEPFDLTTVEQTNDSRDDDTFDDGNDELYEEAKNEVRRAGKASASYLQRRLKIGYARAARLLDLLEERGVIGPGEGAKPREVYDATPPLDNSNLA